jgi:glucose-1-phosphate thymidylyltransferase
MKGIVLAGGLGTRLYPLTQVTNKHLLPVYDKPMIFYPLETLTRAGITDILIVTSGPYREDFLRVLKDGKSIGINCLEYAYQEKPDGGIADALRHARDFAAGEPIVVILGDNITDADISASVHSFTRGAMVFLREVVDACRFGIAEFDSGNPARILRIEEKPSCPKSNMGVTGIYMYDEQVFHFIEQVTPSRRKQLEITDVNNIYIEKGQLNWSELKGFWCDAGTFESLFQANHYWAYKTDGGGEGAQNGKRARHEVGACRTCPYDID